MPSDPNVIFVSFSAILFLFAVMLIFAFNMFRLKQQRKFSPKNEFPFELLQGNDAKHLFYYVIMMLLIVVAILIFGLNVVKTRVYFYEILFIISYILSAILFYLMFFLRLNKIKRHLFIAILYFLLITTSFVSYGLFLQFSPFIDNNLTLAVISYCLGLFSFGMALNPKLVNWPIMDKREQQDGTITILRPKIFILALYEWLYVGLHFVLFIFMFISLLFI